MGSVYSNSIVNIAASWASDGSKGCFSDRKETWRCQIRAGTGGTGTTYD
jgi:hypothetical protein